jgi:hypothetical protein
MIRSWAFYEAWRSNRNGLTLTLDDDVLPVGDVFTEYEQTFDRGAVVSEFLDVPLRRLVRDAYARPTLVALLVAAVGFATIQLFGLATWREFAGATAITAAFGALVALRIGLTTAERGEVVDRALRLVGLRSGA